MRTLPTYRVFDDSLQARFHALRTKIQVYGGAFANGKTSAAVALKTLPIARDYPGANILVARSTYPKLNDTIRREFLKWCPGDWIKSFPRSANASNTCTLINGTEINFRYIQQQGKNEEASTSNLLSANYDLMVVDQIEDPEIEYKDFIDLIGRLRGTTAYNGDDPTMPRDGPRWFVMLCNPTRNWVYKRIIRPLHVYKETGRITDDLLCDRDPDNDEPVLDSDGTPRLIISMVEGSTYDNADNLPADYIRTLEASYRGQMRERFLKGRWGAYEGLVYPEFDSSVHGVDRESIDKYYSRLIAQGFVVPWIEGYDYGLAVPSCYLAGFTDPWGNIVIADGFYKAELSIDDQRDLIHDVRKRWNIPDGADQGWIEADPSIFRRGPGQGAKLVGRSVADMFAERESEGPLKMRRGNSAKLNGITKVRTYMAPKEMHRHPFYEQYGAPHLYYSTHLSFIEDEVESYMWKASSANNSDDKEDEPRDGNDHACDTIKYMFSRKPDVAQEEKRVVPKTPAYSRWQEFPDSSEPRHVHRYRGRSVN
jgi:hypothetical protein